MGIDICVIDNCSTDGTWEWLNDNKILCKKLDTHGCEDIIAQQKLRKKIIEEMPKYKWIIYGNSDEYITSKHSWPQIISAAEENDANLIRMPSFNLRNTGEQLNGKSGPKTYFYYHHDHDADFVTRIHKNDKHVQYSALTAHLTPDYRTNQPEQISFPSGNKIFDLNNSVILNYDATRNVTNEDALLKRRQRASTYFYFFTHHMWNLDLLGQHIGGHWRWSTRELSDIRKHEFYNFIGNQVVDFKNG